MKKLLCSMLIFVLVSGCMPENSKDDVILPSEELTEESELGKNEQSSLKENDFNDDVHEKDECVKKLDETKEYVYIKESKDTITEEFADMSDEVYEELDRNDLLQWMAIKVMPDPRYEHLVLNFEGETAKRLNEEFTNLYEEPIKSKEAVYIEWKWTINQDVLTIINKSGGFSTFLSHTCYRVFHIDLHTGELLTNDDLLSRFNVNKESIQDKIDQYGEEHLFYKEPEQTEERVEGTLGMMVLHGTEYYTVNSEIYNTICYGYSDSSILIIDEDNLYFVLGVKEFSFNGTTRFHKVKLS
ncbi:hypothetical protein [Dielma fastidiosa]|uniref:hypothetical protein n=1 Tax=Dielma fastidiosa TaxID=1034346 RepID=UPI000EF02C69|nr:hypothetical protein [Dielma fastidiosa]HAH93456.1 hypothetical protein [Dielma fastidiosa]